MNQEQAVGEQNVLAVVMARGGSVGLPGKALRPLLGRPVIAYTLDHVRASRLVTRSVVSSDDPAILRVAGAAGFTILERPAELATATSATDPVLRHAVRALYPASEKPLAVVMLYGNVPLRRGQMIDRCVEMLLRTGCDSVQTIAPVGKMHPYWMFDLDTDGGGGERKAASTSMCRTVSFDGRICRRSTPPPGRCMSSGRRC